MKENKMMNSKTEKLPKNSSGLSGEYFVAAELYRRGYSVGMTIGNAKAIDLFAEKDDVVHQVQVKTIRNTKSGGWPLMSAQIKSQVIYVLVNLNNTDQPDYYILTSAEVTEYQKDYNTRGIVSLGPVKKAGAFLNRWDKIQ